MDVYLASLTGSLTAIRGTDCKIDRSVRAQDEFYARYDQDTWFYNFVSAALFAVGTGITGIVARLCDAGDSAAPQRHLAPRI